MAKIDYQARRRAEKQACLEIGEQCGMQKMWDYVQIAVSDPAVVSTHVLSAELLEKVFARVNELDEYFDLAFTDNVEADVRQEELDKCLKATGIKEFHPFRERHPYIQEQSYKKGKNKWR